MEEFEGEGGEEKLRLLNDVDEISERITECKEEWERFGHDIPEKRKGAKQILDQLEPEIMEMAFGFGSDLCKDLRLYLGTARKLLDSPVEEWEDQWQDLIAECDQIEKDMHTL